MRHFAILSLLIFSSFSECLSQNYVVLKYNNGKKRVKIFSGDPFNYYLKNDPLLYHDFLVDVEGDSVVLQYMKIHPKDIEAMDVRHIGSPISNIGAYSSLLIIAGAGYFLIDQFNNSVVYRNKVRLDEGVNRTSATLMGAGALGMSTLFLKRKKVKLEGENKLLLLDLTNPAPKEKPVVEAY